MMYLPEKKVFKLVSLGNHNVKKAIALNLFCIIHRSSDANALKHTLGITAQKIETAACWQPAFPT